MAGDAATLVGDAVVDGVSAMGSAVAVRDYKKNLQGQERLWR